MSNVIVFGKNGQIGSALCKLFKDEKTFKAYSYSSKEVNFSNLDSLRKFLNNLKITPDYIINSVAYTNVDKAEEEKELSNIINHQAVAVIANYCTKNNSVLIHYSTDYVFDGSGDHPFKENNIKNLNPLNHYGRTKLDGEKAAINSGCNYIIMRTSWIWSENGNNFFNTIKNLAFRKVSLNIIDDQIGSPTYAYGIALNTIKIINKLINWQESFPKGIYHITNSGHASWNDFAVAIVDLLRQNGKKLKVQKIRKIKSSEYKTTAKRPLNSRLDCKKLKEVFNLKTKDWKADLICVLKNKNST